MVNLKRVGGMWYLTINSVRYYPSADVKPLLVLAWYYYLNK